jgi:hypothetical protein
MNPKTSRQLLRYANHLSPAPAHQMAVRWHNFFKGVWYDMNGKERAKFRRCVVRFGPLPTALLKNSGERGLVMRAAP